MFCTYGNKDKIWIEKEGHKVTFDIKIPTPKGAVFSIYVKHVNSLKMANKVMDVKKIMIQQAHE